MGGTARAKPAWQPHVCARCGAPITPNEAVRTGHCSAPACSDAARRAAVAAVAPARERERLRQRARALAAAAPQIASAHGAAGVNAAETLVADVPYHGRRLAPADPARQAAFLAHLEGVIAKGFTLSSPDDDGRDAARTADTPPPAAAVAACSACRGWCCQLGAGQMAFLKPADIARHRQAHPADDAATILARYRDHLPAQALDGSCVYHGARGCALPRALRSATCNGFRCFELREIDTALATQRHRLLVAVARDGVAPKALGVAPTTGDAGAERVTVRPLGPAVDGDA